MLLYGPPGTGKTTLARIVAASAEAAFEELSAVDAGARRGARRDGARDAPARCPRRAHGALPRRDPPLQQGPAGRAAAGRRERPADADRRDDREPLLRGQRRAALTAPGLRAQALSEDDIAALLARALERGACGAAAVDDEALSFLAARSGGDARTALQALELACATAGPGGKVTLEAAEDALQRRAVRFDKRGDQHYDTISAWIKATRGSDPDASLYYLAVMIEGGEDARFIARRMVILASEDVGNADPQALVIAVAAAQAVEHVGMPEAAWALSQAAIYLSLAPKSKESYNALGRARASVREQGAQAPPDHLRSAAYPGAEELGRGVGYEDPHRPAGPRLRAGAAARRARRSALLPPRRRRGAAARAARGDPPRARRRVMSASRAARQRRAIRLGGLMTDTAGARIESRSPAGGARLGTVAAASARDVLAAVDRASEVQRLWAMLRIRDRARYMARAAQAVIDEMDELVDLLSREQGRPRAEVEVMEVLPAVETLQWLAERGPRILAGERIGFSRTQHPIKRGRWTYEPLGVIGVIGPAAEPFATPLGDVAVALMAGNGVVLKPSPHAALAGERIARVFARAGLPEGLLRVVHGHAAIGGALVESPVAQVRFTGSRRAGRSVGEACARALKRSVLELGGDDAMLVLADANVTRAARGAVWAAFANAGQSGGSVGRAICLHKVGDRFVDAVVAGARRAADRRPGRPGDGDRPARLERAARAADAR